MYNLKGLILKILVSGLIISLALPEQVNKIASAASTEPRLAHLHPFSQSSIWNTSLGSEAKFEVANSTKNQELRRIDSSINSNNGYGIALNTATETDPVRKVTFQGKTFTHRIPENATILKGSDGNLNVIDGQYVYEYWQVKKNSDGNYTANYGVKTDLLGSGIEGGIRAGQFSTNAGLIRKHELENLYMPHALVMALHDSQMKKGWVFPAISEDFFNDGYTGSIPMGSLFAIPPQVDIYSLGLSPEGLMLAKAMQDYGVYVGDKADNVALYASDDVERELPTQFKNMVKDFQDILQNELRYVTNNSATNIGGGGTRKQPEQPRVVVSVNNNTIQKVASAFEVIQPSFKDIPLNHIYYKEIQLVKEKSLIKGFNDGTFRPNNTIKREHAAVIIERSGANLTPIRPAKEFKDVNIHHPYYSAIQKLYRAGIVDGSAENFNPSGTLTRAQLAKILVEAFDIEKRADNTLEFSDVPSEHWASEYVKILASNGITVGQNGKFMPKDYLTRGHYAVFLSRLLAE